MKRSLPLLVLAGCVTPATHARFADRPIVTASDDQRPISEPAEPPYYAMAYLADALVFDQVVHAVDPPNAVAAGDTNALDEVPNSTWFTNRLGVRPVTPEEAAHAGDDIGPPQPPLQVVTAKKGGANPGFIVKDARGIKYLIKFDTKDNPGLQTGTDALVQKFFWTAGWNTSAETVAHFRRSELTIAPKLHGKITDADLDVMMKEAARKGDEIRATASRFLDGAPKGGWSLWGTREDDPNDRVPHQRRRSIRGLRIFAAWLNHTDLKMDNTLDMYVGEKGHGHLMHYLVDFGEALSGHQSEHLQASIGYEYGLDYGQNSKALISFGLWHRPWERQHLTKWPQISYFGTGTFDPKKWRERYPYTPFKLTDRADAYWATKIILKFDRPLIEAIVAQAQFGDAEAEKYLVDVLVARRDAIGRAYLDDVTPLDELRMTNNTLCGVDLALRHKVASSGMLVIGRLGYRIGQDGHVCIPVDSSPGYHVATLAIRRENHDTPALEVHYNDGHIVGIVR